MDIYYVDCEKNKMLTSSDNTGKSISHGFDMLPFRIQKIILQPNNPASCNIIKKARKRLNEINFNTINSSGEKRNTTEVQYKSFCGLIVEQLCHQMLMHYNTNDNVKIELDESNSPIDQVDLRIIKEWKGKQNELKTVTKNVEIRSSFPFCKIEKAVSTHFDILGGYSNDIKKGEIEKDFYLRFLFSLGEHKELTLQKNGKIDYSATATNILQKFSFNEDLTLKNDMVIYFVGGATKSMMSDESIAYKGTMRSDNFNSDNKGIFNKIKLRNSLDCVSIMRLMLNTITNEEYSGK